MMEKRRIGPFEVEAIGFGCMSLSHAYGLPPPAAQAQAVLQRAFELGVQLFDTAALYGFGANEELVGQALKPFRSKIVLASKCGMTGVDGKRVIDGRPETLKRTCEESLRRLQTDVIDLYYLHRWDKKVPIEDSVGALGELVSAGKIRCVGLSEVSGSTLRKAHAVHPIAAVQNEYSLWTRNPEFGLLPACRDTGAALVAFSPIARGFFGAKIRDAGSFDEKDIRRQMPRFQGESFDANLALLERYSAIAREVGCTDAQLALAWLLGRDRAVIPIPGTTRIAHLEDNLAARRVKLDTATVARLEKLITAESIAGARYNAATQAEIDTEDY
jgi:aryl-alcohol dehydrogenase-like predicted oxidoreductase